MEKLLKFISAHFEQFQVICAPNPLDRFPSSLSRTSQNGYNNTWKKSPTPSGESSGSSGFCDDRQSRKSPEKSKVPNPICIGSASKFHAETWANHQSASLATFFPVKQNSDDDPVVDGHFDHSNLLRVAKIGVLGAKGVGKSQLVSHYFICALYLN